MQYLHSIAKVLGLGLSRKTEILPQIFGDNRGYV